MSEATAAPSGAEAWAMRNRGCSWVHIARYLRFPSPEDAQAAAEEYDRARRRSQ